MRKAVLLLAMAAFTAAGQGGVQTSGTDRSSMARQLIRQALELPPSLNLGFNQQKARILGDSVAVAVMQSMRLKDFEDAGNRERVMRLLEQAFSEPLMITDPGDRQPGATLFLLDYLARQAGTESIGDQARALTKVKVGICPAVANGPICRCICLAMAACLRQPR
jgi:hypothetical protein